MPPSAHTIRPATEADVPEILAMVRELADYEEALDAVQATEQTLLNTLSFPSNPAKGYAKTLLVFDAAAVDRPAGMALYFHNYSTWRSAPGVYLEDLFVRPEHRGKGFGRALLAALAKVVRETGGGRLEWSVLKWNEPSINFYLSPAVGATRMEEWVGMRVEGDERLKKLAESV